MNAQNQITPYGSLTYDQIGTWSDGTPRYQATQSLNSAGQRLLDTSQGTQQNLANLAQEQSGRLSGLLNKPLDWSTQQGYLNDLTAQNLNPQWDRLDQQNETDLVNRGIRPGSTAYGTARDQFLQSRSSAYNNANLGNFNSALQSQLATRQAPVNEILALAGQGQIQQPNFINSPQTGVAGTDVAGITNANYAQQMQGYQQNQGMIGGLFSAGASLIPLLSDRRAKTDIQPVGQLDNGLAVHLYRYNGEGPYHIGLMADEVEEVHPSAVVTKDDGMKMVLYSKAVL